ncbi:hypothetical protein OSTOST_11774, partial [Ostertagia ostertagi]
MTDDTTVTPVIVEVCTGMRSMNDDPIPESTIGDMTAFKKKITIGKSRKEKSTIGVKTIRKLEPSMRRSTMPPKDTRRIEKTRRDRTVSNGQKFTKRLILLS